MKRILVCTGGDTPERHAVMEALTGCDEVIAADSGFDTLLRYGITPDYVIGDMDSISGKPETSGVDKNRVILYPHDKDDTDTELALALALEHGADTTVLLGGGGGRIDHLIGIISIFDRKIHPNIWYTGKEIIESVDDCIEKKGLKGQRVSFFPAGTETCTMISEGLLWPLDALVWKKGSVGISNVVTTDSMKVKMKTGRLLMIRELPSGAV